MREGESGRGETECGEAAVRRAQPSQVEGGQGDTLHMSPPSSHTTLTVGATLTGTTLSVGATLKKRGVEDDEFQI